MDQTTTFDQLPSDRDVGPTILIVDDQSIGRERLRLLLLMNDQTKGYRILMAEGIEQAREALARHSIQVMLLDKNLGPDEDDPSQNGIEAIPDFLNVQPALQILVVTGSTSTEDAARAIVLGAFWFLTKDLPDALIAAQIKKALEFSYVSLQKIQLEQQSAQKEGTEFVGRSSVMGQLRRRILAVAETSKPVLLLGETGTGKTTAARIIHEHRQRYLKQTSRAFFAVNMGAISAELAERELFGNERGAYTDAHQTKPGIFELANNGTLFLDEIGEASLELQVKLLKVIEEGKFRRLGGTHDLHTSFKLVCATNRNLDRMIEDGTFREDLYMRISTFPVTIPTLSERKDDIPDIIRSLLPKCCRETNVQVRFEDLPQDLIEAIKLQPPRGNIRGIEHMLSRLFVYAPKDKKERPVLNQWRKLLSGEQRRAPAVSAHEPLTFKEMMSRPWKVVEGDGFTGLSDFLWEAKRRLLHEAATHHKRGIDIAKALRISAAMVSIEKQKMRHAGDVKSQRPHLVQ